MTRRFDGQRLVIASHNAGKLLEIKALLEPFGVEAISSGSLGLAEPPETETTFAGNARIKAHASASGSGLPALSDDSGITIDRLGGRPGVFTADWAETAGGRDFEMAMKRAWTELEAANAPKPRHAQFRCVLCLAWPDGHDEVFEGAVKGQVVWPMRGDQGFGFDPIFLPDGEIETFGEMEPARKHAMSHRADAFKKLVNACFA